MRRPHVIVLEGEMAKSRFSDFHRPRVVIKNMPSIRGNPVRGSACLTDARNRRACREAFGDQVRRSHTCRAALPALAEHEHFRFGR